MTHYNKISYNIKSQIITFCEKVSKDLSKPNFKFILCMMLGIIASKSVLLSEISRNLHESIPLKKTINRLSTRLKAFSEDDRKVLFNNFLKYTQEHFDERTIFCVDLSDLSKKYSKSLENLGKVHDGSSGKDNVDGYYMFEIAALTHEKAMPLPVYSKIYSNTQPDFLSETDETLLGLKHLSKMYGNIGIRALDRGYDNIKLMKYFVKKKEAFILRAKMNRNVIWNGRTYNILDLTNRFKGQYSLSYTNKQGKTSKVKVSHTAIELPKLKGKKLYLVMVFGYGATPMMLITNYPPKGKKVATSLVKVYLKRWRIEEYFRFKKQEYAIENFRVRSFESIRSLNLLVTLCVGFIGLMSEKDSETVLMKVIDDEAKRLNKPYKFTYYRIADGIYNILKMTKSGIRTFIESIISRTKRSEQLRLDYSFIYN